MGWQQIPSLSASSQTTDPYFEIKKGNVPGQDVVYISAQNPDLDTGPAQDIWGFGDVENMIYPTAGEQWEIFSTDANDTAAGTGCQTVILPYLDDEFNERIEIIALNGITPVPTVATNIYRPTTVSIQLGIAFSVQTAGSSRTNQGDIIARAVGTGQERTIIPAGNGRALDSHFTVPAGRTAYLVDFYVSAQKNKDARVFTSSTLGTDGIFRNAAPFSVFQNSVVIIRPIPVGPFVEKSDLRLVGTTENNNTIVTVTSEIVLIDNAQIGAVGVTPRGLF